MSRHNHESDYQDIPENPTDRRSRLGIALGITAAVALVYGLVAYDEAQDAAVKRTLDVVACVREETGRSMFITDSNTGETVIAKDLMPQIEACEEWFDAEIQVGD